MIRDDLAWLLSAARGSASAAWPGPGRTRDVLDALTERGALFQTDLAAVTGRLPGEIEDALWDGVARGLLTADGFRAVRSLFAQRSLAATALGRHRLRRGGQLASRTAGRWSLLPSPLPDCDPDELAEAVAEQLAVRWGVVFRDLMARENIAVPWRDYASQAGPAFNNIGIAYNTGSALSSSSPAFAPTRPTADSPSISIT